jgi:hypothetical protein
VLQRTLHCSSKMIPNMYSHSLHTLPNLLHTTNDTLHPCRLVYRHFLSYISSMRDHNQVLPSSPQSSHLMNQQKHHIPNDLIVIHNMVITKSVNIIRNRIWDKHLQRHSLEGRKELACLGSWCPQCNFGIMRRCRDKMCAPLILPNSKILEQRWSLHGFDQSYNLTLFSNLSP